MLLLGKPATDRVPGHARGSALEQGVQNLKVYGHVNKVSHFPFGKCQQQVFSPLSGPYPDSNYNVMSMLLNKILYNAGCDVYSVVSYSRWVCFSLTR